MLKFIWLLARLSNQSPKLYWQLGNYYHPLYLKYRFLTSTFLSLLIALITLANNVPQLHFTTSMVTTDAAFRIDLNFIIASHSLMSHTSTNISPSSLHCFQLPPNLHNAP